MIEVDKKDLARLNAKLREIKIGSEKDASDALKYFVVNSRKDILIDAPFDTGNLKRNVIGQMLGKLSAIVESVALSEDGYDYAPVQEYGSVNRPPKPYFYPNIRKNFKRALVVLRNLNKRTVNK